MLKHLFAQNYFLKNTQSVWAALLLVCLAPSLPLKESTTVVC